MMDLARIPAQLAVAWSMHRALTPPNPPATLNTQVTPTIVEQLFRRTIRLAPYLAKLSIWILSAGEIALVLIKSDLVPSTWHATLCKILAGKPSLLRVNITTTRTLVIGAILCVCGCRFRTAAYDALGRHFTFELALAKDQPLVTSYPYNIVRHPAYLGGFTGALGANLALFASRGGWVREILVPWMPRAIVGVGMGALVTLQTLTVVGLSARVPSEDRMMHEHFGREWEKWADRVPYKLIPGLY